MFTSRSTATSCNAESGAAPTGGAAPANAALSSRLEGTAKATAQAIQAREISASWDFFDALDMALACLISYSVMTRVVSPFVAEPDTLLGGMWATAATVFVFRETRASSLAAGIDVGRPWALAAGGMKLGVRGRERTPSGPTSAAARKARRTYPPLRMALPCQSPSARQYRHVV
jgi:hypothetical protein